MMNSALLYIPKLLTGAWLTLQLTGTAVLLGGLLALPLAIALYEQRRGIRHPIALLLSFLRGTPLLAQLFLIYYGAGQFRPELQAIGLWTFFREPFHCALLAFTLNTAAYQTAILRGGLLAVSPGEIEAARAYGFSRWQRYRLIILPNAYRLALPALGNELILLLKGGAVASIVTLLDLMGQTRKLYAQTFDFTVYCYAAIGYLCITSTLLWVWHRLALHLNRHRIVTPRPRRRWILTTDRS